MCSRSNHETNSLAREHLVVAVRPAEPREEVDHRLRQVALVLVLHHADGAVPLGELLAVLAEHGRHVREDRRLGAERAEDVDLPRRVVDVIVAADHVRDPHVDVVDDDAEVVGRRAVRPRDHEIVELGVGDLDAALDPVVPGDAAVERILEADHRRDARPAASCRRRSPAASGRRSAASRRAPSAPRAARRARPAACSSGRRDRAPPSRAGPRDSGPSAASGRTGPRRSRARATPSRRGSPARPPASSARRRCPRCAG